MTREKKSLTGSVQDEFPTQRHQRRVIHIEESTTSDLHREIFDWLDATAKMDARNRSNMAWAILIRTYAASQQKQQSIIPNQPQPRLD